MSSDESSDKSNHSTDAKSQDENQINDQMIDDLVQNSFPPSVEPHETSTHDTPTLETSKTPDTSRSPNTSNGPSECSSKPATIPPVIPPAVPSRQGYAYKSPQELRESVNSEGRAACPNCSYTCSRVRDLKRHFCPAGMIPDIDPAANPRVQHKTVEINHEGRASCPTCPATFARVRDLKRHKCEGPTGQLIQCIQCVRKLVSGTVIWSFLRFFKLFE